MVLIKIDLKYYFTNALYNKHINQCSSENEVFFRDILYYIMIKYQIFLVWVVDVCILYVSNFYTNHFIK